MENRSMKKIYSIILFAVALFAIQPVAKAEGETKQALYSYRLTFSFTTEAGALEYLRGRTFTVPRVAFAEKYFPGYEKVLPPL